MLYIGDTPIINHVAQRFQPNDNASQAVSPIYNDADLSE